MPETPSPGPTDTVHGDQWEKNPRPDPPAREVHLLGENSPGVRRIEIISSHFRLVDRIFLFLSVFLIAYVYGLDGTVRNTYQVRSPTNPHLIGTF